MSGEFEDKIETRTKSKGKPSTKKITLRQAIDFGEYDIDYLSTFAEWHTLTKIMQWRYVREAIANRKNFLWKQWADINNFLDFSKKPELKIALNNIQNQIEKLAKDEERLQLEFSS